MGERTRAGTMLPLLVSASYVAAALRTPLDPALLLSLGPLACALAVARTRQLPVLLLAAAPAVALVLRVALVGEASSTCGCTPALNAALLAGALVAGARLDLSAAVALGLGPLGATFLDVTGPGLSTGVYRPLPWESGFALVGAALLLAGGSVARRQGAHASLAGVLACAILGTGLSWHKSLELPALTGLMDRPSLWNGRAAWWAYHRLLERGDEPAVRILLKRADDGRLIDVHRAATRLGAAGDGLLEAELRRGEHRWRLSALGSLTGRGPLGSRAAFLDALATHRVHWPAGAFSAAPAIESCLAQLEAPEREAWYPATMRLLRGRAPGPIDREPPLAQSIARLAGLLPPTGGLDEYHLLWHRAEGVRLAAAAAIALNPAGVGRAGEAPRVLHILAEARARDRATPFDVERTPFGPTAPLRLLMFGELKLRDRLSPEALQACATDPVPLIAAMATQGRGAAGTPPARHLLELTDLHPRVDARR